MNSGPRIRILEGHNLEKLARLPSESIHCCVTSPPYWGLRDYKLPQVNWPTGWLGQHGLEPTLDLYIEHEVLIFRQVRRVLRSDGTLWVNLGDTYATNGGHSDVTCNDRRGQYNIGNRPDKTREFRSRPSGSIKTKDLCGVPWRVAFALQADGWYLRSDIVWQKPNPMPESVTDRPTKSHEYFFLLTKTRKRYYYDAEAIKEPASGTSHPRGTGVNPKAKVPGRSSRLYQDRDPQHSATRKVKQNESFSAAVSGLVARRNRRSVWTVATVPFKGAHFATFPPLLIEPCILAGTSEKGCCPQCLAPWRRIVAAGERLAEWQRQCGGDLNGEYHGHNRKAQPASTVKARILGGMKEKITVGWRPSCSCAIPETTPCTVLDPFGGAGTVAKVACELGRSCIIIDLSPEYVRMSESRLSVLKSKSKTKA